MATPISPVSMDDYWAELIDGPTDVWADVKEKN